MNFKKCISMLLVVIMIFGTLSVSAYCIGSGYANIIEQFYFAERSFSDGIGPELNGYTIDYLYFSPVECNDKKYPLVIWIPGLGCNAKPGDQLGSNDIEAWVTPELQQRFTGANGAHLFVPRSPKNIGWDKTLIYPLKAAIDDFVAKNKNNIDLSRIYIGGFSQGGWMALKIAEIHPEMFAALFPSVPAYRINNELAEKIADIPVWLTCCKKDPFVNYYTTVNPTWKKIIAKTNIPEKCRFSILSKAYLPDGETFYNNHMAWFAVNYDMFSSEDSDYPCMSTIDGNGNTITLTYPNGIISWLSSFKSDYDGSPATDGGNDQAYTGFAMNVFGFFIACFKNFTSYLKLLFI